MAEVTSDRTGRPGTAPSERPLPASSFAATLTQASPPRDPGARDEPSVGPRVGRFTILERLAAGNMGVVFTAYDDVLDRKIAIKVLRGGGEDASLRLLREAQAMARVDHPNVVTVHEVGTSDDQVYVAMEFIRGTTLQVWQREPGRRWQEVVEAYIQAGRGLAAAHAAGLIHRDFKPSNAMIDADGRVRVLDFGLVRAQDSAPAVPLEAAASRQHIAVQLTHAGDVLGTPAYMSPEQIRGQEVGPGSDQFSLCASLYEGLYGSLPFAGDSLGALFRAILRERLPEPPRGTRVPTWVRAALARGMRADPKARFPSIDALLRALGASSARRRRVGIGVGVGLIAAAALAGFLAARAQAPERCGGAGQQIAGAYDPTIRARIEASLAAAGPAVDAELRPAVVAALDDYADAWTTTHRDACLAHARGEQSDVMLDRRMACLAQRRAALGEASSVLAEGEAGVALESLRIVHELPAIARCSELDVLASEVAPPSNPAVAVAVDETRRALARAGALLRAGKIDAALALADRSVEQALRSDYRPLAAEALLVRSRLALNVVDDSEDDARLTRAMLTAIGSGVDEVAAEAAARRVFVRGRFAGLGRPALADVPLAEELARRLPQPEAILGLLANNVGTVHLGRGELPEARAAFARALERRERALSADDPELAYTLMNLALVEQDTGTRQRHIERAFAIFSSAFGPGHPQTIDMRMGAARYILDPAAASALLAPGCEALERFLPGDFARRARCLADLAHHAGEAGDRELAAARWRQAEAQLARLPAPKDVADAAEATALAGRAAAGQGRDDATVVGRLREQLATFPRDTTLWWQRRDRAEFEVALAANLGAVDEAVGVLALAIADLEATRDQTRDVFSQQMLAAAHLRMAELQSPDRGPAEEISSHLDAAEKWYRASGAAYGWRLGVIAAMRAATP